MKKSVQGFTLVELIIVVAIISLLSVSAMVFMRTNSESADNSVRQNDIQTVEAALGSQSSIQGSAFADTGQNLVLDATQRAAIQDKNLNPPSSTLDLHPINPALAEYLSLSEEELLWYAVDDYNRVYYLGFPATNYTPNDNTPAPIDDDMIVTEAPSSTPRPTPPSPPAPEPPVESPPAKGPGATLSAGDIPTSTPVPTPSPTSSPTPSPTPTPTPTHIPYDWDTYVDIVLGGYRGLSDGNIDNFPDVNTYAGGIRGVCFYQADANGNGYYYIITQKNPLPKSSLTTGGEAKYDLSTYYKDFSMIQVPAVNLDDPSNHLQKSNYGNGWNPGIKQGDVLYSNGSYYVWSQADKGQWADKWPASPAESFGGWMEINTTNLPHLES